MASFSVAIRLSLLISLPFAIASCYYPNGSIVLDPAYQPCIATVGSGSMCCATNRTAFADVCLPNGLCHNPCSYTGYCGGTEIGQFWRETCTDSTWTSPYCLGNVCTNNSAGGSLGGDSRMTQCLTDNTWCCNNDLNSEDCCAASNRVALAPTIGVGSNVSVITSSPTTTTSSASSTSSMISSSTTSSFPSASPTAAPLGLSPAPTVYPSSTSDTSSSGIGMKVGLGVGLVLGISAIAVVTVFFLLRRRKAQAPTLQGRRHNGEGMSELEGEAGGRPGFFKRFLELHATEKKEMVYEVPG